MREKKTRIRMRFSTKYILLFVLGVFSILVYCNQKIITRTLTTFFNQISNIDYSSTFDSNLPHDSDYTFGIDVSKYQGKIKWNMINESHHPIEYVIMRSTMGDDRKDIRYKENWIGAKKQGFIRGAYHYYDPNENSTKQAHNFIESVKLEVGDLPPILDIEAFSKFGNNNLRRGIKNWLQIIEEHYRVTPIIYTGLSFYNQQIKGSIDNKYPLWIAAYSGRNRLTEVDWIFHQFTTKVNVKGIRGKVDGNDFNGSLKQLKNLTI